MAPTLSLGPEPSAGPGLIADIGGTNARFALVGPDGLARDARTLLCADYDGPAQAARAYLAEVRPPRAPGRGAFCVACPVVGDAVALTNNPWRFSVEATRQDLGLAQLAVVNDFVANALAVPLLTAADKVQVGGGAAVPDMPMAVIGPGTGLGVALLVPAGEGRVVPVATEGGHVTMPATDDREAAVLERLSRRFDHVSAERVVSGAGIVNVYQALCGLEDVEPATGDPAEIGRRALDGEDGLCLRTLHLVFGMLGTVAGNLALSSGALGGVTLMGGIVPRYLDLFRVSPFREKFEAKGRFRAYLRNVPVHVVTHPYPAFVGLAGLVAGE